LSYVIKVKLEIPLLQLSRCTHQDNRYVYNGGVYAPLSGLKQVIWLIA